MRTNQNKQFPRELKESVARRYLTTDLTYRELAEEIGACSWSVRAWVKNLRETGSVAKDKKRKKRKASTDKRPSEEKLRLLLEARSLSEEERGAFLRREGVHDGDLERWEREALGGLAGAVSSGEGKDCRIRELEQDKARAEKRLREAKALLELQKKVQALWADEDGDTPQSSGKS